MDQVRKLLKRKLQEHHPDKGHDPSEKVATHAEMVHTINELLELLPRNAEADSAEAVESWRRRAMAAEERNAELESQLAGEYDDDGEDLEVSSSREKLIYDLVNAYGQTSQIEPFLYTKLLAEASEFKNILPVNGANLGNQLACFTSSGYSTKPSDISNALEGVVRQVADLIRSWEPEGL